jgi:hypothetical protein
MLIGLFLTSIVFFPAVIFLDYHKRRNISNAIWFLIVFFTSIVFLAYMVKQFSFALIPLVIIIPAVLFGALFLKNKKK